MAEKFMTTIQRREFEVWVKKNFSRMGDGWVNNHQPRIEEKIRNKEYLENYYMEVVMV